MSNINASTGSTIIEEIDRLKGELDKLRPLPADVVGRIGQKLRLDSNYHSNAIEGNSLTLGETRSLILHGLTTHGKPMRDHLKASRGEDIEDVEDIDKEIALFKRSLQKSTGDTIEARKYADKVLYPLFFYCKEKIDQFSDMFEFTLISPDDSSVRVEDYQVSAFSLSEGKSSAWPENALFISTQLEFYLHRYQAKQEISFNLTINNEIDSNRCVWKFHSEDPEYDKEYTGQDLEVLKKMFNEMIRRMMKNLSGNSDSQ